MAGRRDEEEASPFPTAAIPGEGRNRTRGDLLRIGNSAGHASLRLMPSPSTTAMYLHVTDTQQRRVYERAWERRNGNGEEPEVMRRLRYFLEDTL